jgi:hypothetical protein
MLVEAKGLVAVIAPQGIDGLVGGNRVQPRPHRPACLVLPALLVQGQKRVLKHVFRQFAVAQVAAQVTVKLALVAAQKNPERFPLAVTKPA